MPDANKQDFIEPLAVSSVRAASLLDFTESFLAKDRATGCMGVPYVKAGRRVVYRLSDLTEWLKANRVVPAISSTGGQHDAPSH